MADRNEVLHTDFDAAFTPSLTFVDCDGAHLKTCTVDMGALPIRSGAKLVL